MNTPAIFNAALEFWQDHEQQPGYDFPMTDDGGSADGPVSGQKVVAVLLSRGPGAPINRLVKSSIVLCKHIKSMVYSRVSSSLDF